MIYLVLFIIAVAISMVLFFIFLYCSHSPTKIHKYSKWNSSSTGSYQRKECEYCNKLKERDVRF